MAPSDQEKKEQLKFTLDDIIAEVRRPGWASPAPGAAAPEEPKAPAFGGPVREAALHSPEPEKAGEGESAEPAPAERPAFRPEGEPGAQPVPVGKPEAAPERLRVYEPPRRPRPTRIDPMPEWEPETAPEEPARPPEHAPIPDSVSRSVEAFFREEQSAGEAAPRQERRPEPDEAAGEERTIPLPRNVEELAAHFAPEPGHSTKRSRQEKKARNRAEKEREREEHAQRLEQERHEAAEARRREERGDYVPRRMKPEKEAESQRIYREAMAQFGKPEEPPRKKNPPRKPEPEPVAEPARRERRPGLPYDRFHQPYTDPAQGMSALQSAMAPLAFSLILQAVVLAVTAYLTLAYRYPLPLPPGFCYDGYTRLYAGILLGLQVLSLGLSWEVARAGVWRLLHGRPTLDTVVLLASLTSMGHTVLVLCRPVSLRAYFPMALLSGFLGFMATLAKRQRVDALRRKYKVAMLGSAPQTVKTVWDKPRLAVKTGEKGYFNGDAMALHDRAETASCWLAPLILLAALVLGLGRSLWLGQAEYSLWAMTLLLSGGAAPALMCASSLPGLRAARWLAGSGAALINDRTARELAATDQVLLRDGDIYPAGIVTITSLKLADGVDLNRVLSCAAAVAAHIGGGLDKAFSDFARQQYLQVFPAREFELYENGGATGVVGRDNVVMGTAAFLTRMGVRIEEGMRIPHGVFLAVNSRFSAVFEVRYGIQPQPFEAFELIRRAHLRPRLGTLDFTVTGLTVETRFHLKSDWCIYPSLEERRELHDPAYGRESPTLAILNRDSMLPFAESVLAARRVTGAGRWNVFWGILSSLAGVGLMYMLAAGGKTELATPENILVFQLLWMVPVYFYSWLKIRK